MVGWVSFPLPAETHLDLQFAFDPFCKGRGAGRTAEISTASSSSESSMIMMSLGSSRLTGGTLLRRSSAPFALSFFASLVFEAVDPFPKKSSIVEDWFVGSLRFLDIPTCNQNRARSAFASVE